MSEKAYRTEIMPPIVLLPGIDPERIGEHYKNLRKAATRDAYAKLGEEVTVEFSIEQRKDGSSVVRLFEEHNRSCK